MTMKVFISWSGDRAKQLAVALADWMPDVLQATDPFVSTGIEGGLDWFAEIKARLKESKFGVVCLTHESYEKPWVNFESGALFTAFDNNRVCPYFLDGNTLDYKEPLSRLNMMKADRAGTLGLLKSIATVLEENNECPPRNLERIFDRSWPQLEQRLGAIPPHEDGESLPKKRSADDMFKEILGILRHLQLQPSTAEAQLLETFNKTPGDSWTLKLLKVATRADGYVTQRGLSVDQSIHKALTSFRMPVTTSNFIQARGVYRTLYRNDEDPAQAPSDES